MPGDYFTRQRGELIRYNELTYLFMRRTYYLKKKCSEKPTTTNVKPATMKAPVACRLPMTASTSWILMRAGILSYTTQDQPIEDVKDMRTITISFVRYLCMCTLPPFQQGWSVLTCHPYHCQGVEVVPIHCPPCSPRPAKGRTTGNPAALPPQRWQEQPALSAQERIKNTPSAKGKLRPLDPG